MKLIERKIQYYGLEILEYKPESFWSKLKSLAIFLLDKGL